MRKAGAAGVSLMILLGVLVLLGVTPGAAADHGVLCKVGMSAEPECCAYWPVALEYLGYACYCFSDAFPLTAEPVRSFVCSL